MLIFLGLIFPDGSALRFRYKINLFLMRRLPGVDTREHMVARHAFAPRQEAAGVSIFAGWRILALADLTPRM